MLSARPPAKVNLTLEVLGRRDDGYHELRSIFVRVGGLSDRLTVVPGSQATDTLTVNGIGGVSARGNVVLAAFDHVRARAGVALPRLDATLDKRIPAAAGLGGGSSDGASALALAQAAWGITMSPADALSVAATLGSDVPFFARDVAVALVEGRGERVTPLPEILGNAGILLVTPPTPLSTPAVFARYDEIAGQRPVARGNTDDLARSLAEGLDGADLEGWADELRHANSLWPAAASLEHSLATLRDGLELATRRPWLMSGSGPTLFAVYASAEEAAQAGRSVLGSVEPADTLVHAAGLTGPDPAWRYP